MRIDRIRLADYKRHHELENSPAPGLTVIRGPNEAGKSTIAEALELVLFRKADANRDDIRKAWAWGSQDSPEVSLDFEVDGKSGTLTKRFDGARAEAELNLDGQSVRDYTRDPGSCRSDDRHPHRVVLPSYRQRGPCGAGPGRR